MASAGAFSNSEWVARHLEWIEGISGAEYCIAARGRHDTDLVRAVDKAGGGKHQPQSRAFAAAHAGAGPAGVKHAAIGKHHIAQCLIVHETFGRARQMAEKVHADVILQQIHGGLWNHVQSTVRAAGSDALPAAFAFVRIDKDAEHAAGFSTLGGDVMILVGLHEELMQRIAKVFALNHSNPLFENAGLYDTRQDGRVRTLIHTLHAAPSVVDGMPGNADAARTQSTNK